MDTRRPLKVAIIGTGLAGLTAGHLLEREASRRGVELEVHLFEKSSSLGFHSSSITIPPSSSPSSDSLSYDDDGILAKKASKPWIVDVPMRSFQGGYYPHLLALYKSLFIPIKRMAFDYSFSHLDSTSPPTMSTHFLYEGSNGLALPSLPASSSRFTSLGRLLTYALSYLYLLLLSFSFWLFRWPGGTVEEWTRKVGRGIWGGWVGSQWEKFVEEILGALFGAVGTCRDQDVGGLEVGLLLEYIYLTLFTDHYTAPTSSSSISRALTGSITPSNIHLSTSITSLRRDVASSTTSISFTTSSSGETITMEGFDEIIIGTQANQAKRLLDSLLETLEGSDASEVGEVATSLGSFRYVKTIVVNHTSPTVLPTPSSDIRDINLLRCPSPPPLLPTSDGLSPPKRLDYFPPSPQNTYTQSTHILYPPPTHSETHGSVYQTTNPIMRIPEESILSIAHLERALPTALSTSLLPRLLPSHPQTLQGKAGVWFVGAYAWKGIPLLEGCVRSSEEVVMGKGGILEKRNGEREREREGRKDR
ncbi:hypothetical protein BDY24DRAFT_414404 [Mrakia frigida]|uniref:uncharacterized protein n=1 Tax=Mrakia frigida TaxID=29902 RepID=UPI003FCC2322